MWLRFHKVKNLTVSEEDHHTSFDHVLENEILVIVTHLKDIGVNDIIYGTLPFGSLIIEICEMVDFLLTNFGIQNLLINPSSQCRWNTPLRILYQERLVILL